MYPVLLEIPSLGISIPSWHLLYALSALWAYLFLHFLARSFFPTLNPGVLDKGYLAGYVASYLGARCISILIEESPQSLGDFLSKVIVLGPMTFYGGLIGCTIGISLVLWKEKVSLRHAIDLFFPVGLSTLFLGRIGCFLNGDDYGIPADLSNGPPWWSIQIPALNDQIFRHPVQLYEAAYSLLSTCAWIVLLRLTKGKDRVSGLVGITSLSVYAIFRFNIEWLRDDPRGSWRGFSTSQILSVLILMANLAAAAVILFRQFRAALHRRPHGAANETLPEEQ